MWLPCSKALRENTRMNSLSNDTSAAREDVPGEQQVGSSDRHVHRHGPLDTEARRVRGDEVEYLILELARELLGLRAISIRAGEGRREGQLRQVLEASQFPWHLHVRATDIPVSDVAIPGGLRPAEAGPEVELPVDGLVVRPDK